MATAAYNTWVKKGRPYTVAEPIKQIVAMARNAGIPILGVIGSDDKSHLQASKPQDHTPFSVTAWPNPLPGYVVTACDIKNGPWSQRLLDAAKRGEAPYIKYMNFGGRNYDVRRNWDDVSSDDQHLHVSCRTDYLSHSPRFNPFVVASPQIGREAGMYVGTNPGGAIYGVGPNGPVQVTWEEWKRFGTNAPPVLWLDSPSKLDLYKPGNLMSPEQIRELAQHLAQETDVSTVETALRNVLLKGVEPDGS